MYIKCCEELSLIMFRKIFSLVKCLVVTEVFSLVGFHDFSSVSSRSFLMDLPKNFSWKKSLQHVNVEWVACSSVWLAHQVLSPLTPLPPQIKNCKITQYYCRVYGKNIGCIMWELYASIMWSLLGSFIEMLHIIWVLYSVFILTVYDSIIIWQNYFGTTWKCYLATVWKQFLDTEGCIVNALF